MNDCICTEAQKDNFAVDVDCRAPAAEHWWRTPTLAGRRGTAKTGDDDE